MELYDPVLTGWGIDLWYMDLFGYHPKKIAIVDDITCINPHDDTKGGQREIELLEKKNVSIENWLKILQFKLFQPVDEDMAGNF